VGARWFVAHRPWVAVLPVSQPTITVYSPEGKNTGAAVVVLPGGGYQILAIDLEGTEVCDWLVSKGITAVLLKYRVPLGFSAGGHLAAAMSTHFEQRLYPAVDEGARNFR
jgi:acetyl esterase/lipase